MSCAEGERAKIEQRQNCATGLNCLKTKQEKKPKNIKNKNRKKKSKIEKKTKRYVKKNVTDRG